MSRLPSVGGDDNQWGNVLNDYLAVSHNADGSPKSGPTYAVPQSINAQTGTTYVLVFDDAGKFITLSNASAITLTVPPNSSVAFPVGTHIDLLQLGAGQVTVAAGGGVSIHTASTLKSNTQYSGMALTKLGTNEWVLVGDVE